MQNNTVTQAIRRLMVSAALVALSGGAFASAVDAGEMEVIEAGIPILGAAAVAFGILGIFSKGYIFVPLGVVCSILSLFLGQISWAFVGFLLATAGLLTSPVLLSFLGIAWLLPW